MKSSLKLHCGGAPDSESGFLLCVFAPWRLCVEKSSLSVKSPDSESGWLNSFGGGWPRIGALAEEHAIPTKFLPQRNAKIAEATTYGVFPLRSMRSFAANSCLIAAWPRCADCGSLRQIIATICL
jgi:hypothetical protein